MKADQASDYAIANGGASFRICPVCEEHFPDHRDNFDRIVGIDDQGIEAHLRSHDLIDVVRALVDWRGRATKAEQQIAGALSALNR